MTDTTILVIEDDPAIRSGLESALKLEGYRTLSAADGTHGMELGLKATCNLVLLDLVLPGPSGFEILASIRQHRPELPVIILTAMGEETDRIEGLRRGADDYVVKPFSVAELVARVSAVLRRSYAGTNQDEILIPGGKLMLAQSRVLFEDGTEETLSDTETRMLGLLARQSGRVINRDEILARVWRLEGRRLETRTIDMHITRLRTKLRDDAKNPRVLLTIRGKGYLFEGS
ncbi:MAG: response regulator transcription factor [Planctomycetota bacterium]